MDVNRKCGLDDIKFVLLRFFTLMAAIWLQIWAKPPLQDVEKSTSGWRASFENAFLYKLPNQFKEPFVKYCGTSI